MSEILQLEIAKGKRISLMRTITLNYNIKKKKKKHNKILNRLSNEKLEMISSKPFAMIKIMLNNHFFNKTLPKF